MKITSFGKGRTTQKIILFIFLSIVIGYLISPRIIFRPTIYNEGDIILQTISINEDLLIPDKVSTKLKQDKLLNEQSRIYVFDPNVYDKIQTVIHTSFKTIREIFEKLENQEKDLERKNRAFGLNYFNSISSLQETQKQAAFYKSYKAVINSRLRSLKGEGTLTAKGFAKKAKLDSDLNKVNQVLAELQEKINFLTVEKENFPERYTQLKKESEGLAKKIKESKSEAITNIDKSFAIELSESERQLFGYPFYTREFETQLLMLLSEILTNRIVVSKEVLPESKEMIELRDLVNGDSLDVEDTNDFFDLAEARDLVSQLAKEYFANDEESAKERTLMTLLGQKLIKPTVSENKQAYEEHKAALIADMSPVFFSVKKGEIIARAGDRVSRSQVELINSYYELVSNRDKWPGVIGVILLVLLALVLVSITFSLPTRKVQVEFRDVLLVMTSVVITLLLVKGGAMLGELFETRYLNVQIGSYYYILPVALGSMLAGILLYFEAALLTGLLTAVFCSIMLQSDLYYFCYAIMGSLVASIPITKFDSRYSILLHGLKISAINVPMIMIIYLIEVNQVGVANWSSYLAALLGGLLIAIITSFILPFLESIFDVTTNLKLLELSNMNHPVLKELILKAPGTYQHSLIVGNLAEAGAAEIGANPLLARVAAYYHDIGKSVDSHYFIENQAPNYPNIHDAMDPFESAKVIIQHMHDGVEKSEKGRLGRAITEILQQHHGTSLVKYFYSKAKEQSEKYNSTEHSKITVDKQDFRYPGPKPQSLEAALVMLADVSEAATRSLDSPTPELIQQLVTKISWNILEDGQLDECGFTLKTFHNIVDIYSKMLVSFHHHRIKYPEIEVTPPPTMPEEIKQD